MPKPNDLNCPRCGQQSEYQDTFDGHSVKCLSSECYLESPAFDTKQEAIDYWTWRPATPTNLYDLINAKYCPECGCNFESDRHVFGCSLSSDESEFEYDVETADHDDLVERGFVAQGKNEEYLAYWRTADINGCSHVRECVTFNRDSNKWDADLSVQHDFDTEYWFGQSEICDDLEGAFNWLSYWQGEGRGFDEIVEKTRLGQTPVLMRGGKQNEAK